jgi:integrase
MRFSHNAWYHVAKGKWTRLGDTYAGALLEYAKLEAARVQRRDVKALLTAFIAHPGRAASTTRNYRIFRSKLDKVFGHVAPADITLQDARRYLDEHPKASMARHEISLLSAALTWGAERGWLPSNPLLGWRKGPVMRRKRYITEAEYQAILANARPDVAEAIRFLYITALRVRDALALRWSDVKDDGLHVTVHKTKDALILSGAALDEQLKALKGRSVVSMHILTGSGRPLTYTILRRHFKAAAAKAGCPDVTIHDLRRKRITDLTNEKGRDFAQRLAAHSDPKTTDSYYADKVRVQI